MPAPATVPPLAPVPPPPVPAGPSITFGTSSYKNLYNAVESENSVEDIWKAVQVIVATCSGDGPSGELVAQRFVKRLKMTYITANKKYEDETDADKLAVLLWSSTELSTDPREFCSYLNQSLRADKDPPLYHAVVHAYPCHRLRPSLSRSVHTPHAAGVRTPAEQFPGGQLWQPSKGGHRQRQVALRPRRRSRHQHQGQRHVARHRAPSAASGLLPHEGSAIPHEYVPRHLLRQGGGRALHADGTLRLPAQRHAPIQ